ncbi:hypothetical protein GH714_009743 [Hevea brasiliensis]|uniref:Uncharacterized protein n=1 Tax=Hevea brasiliensis TaxID=3981 RepID=A0A6A6M110_HEVBR|nr:hypothetical protein GH714_009743 [Hevea brasiliensis]
MMRSCEVRLKKERDQPAGPSPTQIASILNFTLPDIAHPASLPDQISTLQASKEGDAQSLGKSSLSNILTRNIGVGKKWKRRARAIIANRSVNTSQDQKNAENKPSQENITADEALESNLLSQSFEALVAGQKPPEAL